MSAINIDSYKQNKPSFSGISKVKQTNFRHIVKMKSGLSKH